MVWIIICCVNAIGTKSKRNKEREPLIYFRSAREQGRETWLEGETADWTYGFGKFQVLLSEQFPAVNLLCLFELLLKPNLWPNPRSFISAGQQGGIFPPDKPPIHQ